MDDSISRKSAIDELCVMLRTCFGADDEELDAVTVTLNNMPSAQPEPCADTISRNAAIDAHYEYCNKHPDAGFPVWSLKILEDLPSAQPEMIREIRKWINSGNRGNADYFIVEKIEEIINKYE